ncbi:MAG TPA: hypothetical protein EYG66_04710 [Mariprofundaceae bacterium]|nr:hypothetical protein [Mariprofundaceae bacterium]
MKNETVKPFSVRLLLSIFIISLLVFMLLRWDVSSFLRHQIDNAAKQEGYTLIYDEVSISGLSIVLQPITIQQGKAMSIQLDKIQLSPSFSQLTSGILGLDINTTWLGNPISATVVQDGDVIQLLNIDAMIDVSRLDDLNIPVQLSGLMHLQGELQLLQSTGQPQSGRLTLTWNNAKAGLAAPEFTLGDYQVNINSVDDVSQPWQWAISGGSGVALNGSGTLLANNPDPKRWAVTGLVDANIDNSNPSLAMMMQGVMGSNQAKFRISGSLGAPRTVIVR